MSAAASTSRPWCLAPVLALSRRLRTRARLTTLVVLLLLPALLATWSFGSVMGGQVDFAASERAGVLVVRPAVLALAEVAAGSNADLSAVRAAVQEHPELAADEALGAVEAAAAAGDSPTSRARTAGALAGLVTAVGDSSKLILDPDLDSFYVMDALVVQLPKALVAVAGTAAVDPATPAADLPAVRAVEAGALAAAADAVRSDVATAARTTMRTALEPALDPALTAADRVTDLAAALADRPTAVREQAARTDAARAGGVAVEPLADELDALLSERTDGLTARRDTTLALTLAGLALAGWFASAVLWGTRRDVELTLAAADAINQGDLHPRVLPTGKDEMADIGRALDAARDRLQQLLLAVGGSTGVLRDASGSLVDVSTQLRVAAEESAAEAVAVAASATQVSAGLQTVRAGTGEVAAAVRGIAGSAGSAADVAAEALTRANAAGESVQRLGRSSTEIAEVLALIGTIAAQTNLLALNASIEAARAGEYGSGFSVVAHEVKELAQQTATATEEVSRRIAGVETAAAAAAAALGEMHEVTARMTRHQDSIVTAVEAQQATTDAMTRDLAVAADGSQSIARTIAAVAGAAERTTDGATRTNRAAGAVADVSSALDRQLSAFSY